MSSCKHISSDINRPIISQQLLVTGILEDCLECKPVSPRRSPLPRNRTYTMRDNPLWLCLQCGNQGCGRKKGQHAWKHFESLRSSNHSVCINTTTLEFWCYECCKYLEPTQSRELYEVREVIVETMKSLNSCSLLHLELETSRPRGLRNFGNSSFFNSVMQCIAQTPYLLELLIEASESGTYFRLPGGKINPQDAASSHLEPIEGNLEKWSLISLILAETILEMKNGKEDVYTPTLLYDCLSVHKCQTGVPNLYDACELFLHLIETVHQDDLNRYESTILKQLSTTSKFNLMDPKKRAVLKFYKDQASDLLPLAQVFRGSFLGVFQYKDCLHSFCKREAHFFNLSLPITETQRTQLELMDDSETFEEFCESINTNLSLSETLSARYPSTNKGENALQNCLGQSFTYLGDKKKCCGSCLETKGISVQANITGQHLVYTPPAVLVVHLKRFQISQFGSTKIEKSIKFANVLDLAPYCAKTSSFFRNDQTEVLYALYGVVEHRHSLDNGHYVAYVKKRPKLRKDNYRWWFLPQNQKAGHFNSSFQDDAEVPQGKWYFIKDSEVSEVSESKVLSAQAYMLFYERIL